MYARKISLYQISKHRWNNLCSKDINCLKIIFCCKWYRDSLTHFIILFENILFKRYFSNNYFIILRWCGLMFHVAWCFIFLEKYDQATVTIKHRCWHQLVLDMTWYEDEFDFNMIKQRCQLNTDVVINWFRTWNDKKMNLILSRSKMVPIRCSC